MLLWLLLVFFSKRLVLLDFYPLSIFAKFYRFLPNFLSFSSFLSSKQFLFFCFTPSVFWCFTSFSILFILFILLLLLWLLLVFFFEKAYFLDFYPLSILPIFKHFLPNLALFGLFCFGFFIFFTKAFLLRRTVALTNTHPLLSLLCAGFGGWVCVSALFCEGFFFIFLYI